MRSPSALRRCAGFAKRATDNSLASLPFDVLDYTGLTHMHNRVIRGKYAAHLHFATKGASVALSAQSRQNPHDNSFTFCRGITKLRRAPRAGASIFTTSHCAKESPLRPLFRFRRYLTGTFRPARRPSCGTHRQSFEAAPARGAWFPRRACPQ